MPFCKVAMWSLTDAKFAVISLGIALLLTMGYCGAAYLIPWVSAVEEVSETVKIFVSVVATMVAMAFLTMKFDTVRDWEGEIIGELTVHQEPAIFRLSTGAGLVLLFVLGTALRLQWPMRVGFVAGGIFLLLYLVDIAIEVFTNWDEAIENILSEGGHALRMVGMAGILVLAGAILCVAHYKRLTIPRPLPPPPEEKGIVDRLEDIYKGVKKKIPFASDGDKKEIEQMLEGLDEKKLGQWIEEMREECKEPGYREFLDELPRKPEQLGKWLREQEEKSEAKRFVEETWEHLRKKKESGF